jgi:predicted transglutaminase-like cysteine proteinase
MTRLIALLCLMFALPAYGEEATALPPYGWLEYCATGQNTECSVGREITPHDAMYVNMTVNHTIKGKVDKGVETWRAFPPDRKGDCDEYALTKRASLIALGKSPMDMNLSAGRLKSGEKHIVLEIHFPGVVYVLDNLTDDVYTPDARPYEWTELQRQDPQSVTWTGWKE